MSDVILTGPPTTRQQARAWQVIDDDGNPVTLWLPDRSRCWSYFTITSARAVADRFGGRFQQSTTRTIKDAVVSWQPDPAVHECGIRFDGAPPKRCIDPGAHRGYAIVPAPASSGGSLTGAQLEDRAAALASAFNRMGIVADPGRFGGAVLYPTAEQAATLLWALDKAGAVMPATPAHADPARNAEAARQQRA